MDYITPLMFGAVGNGKVDDTVALRKSISASHSSEFQFLSPVVIHSMLRSLLTRIVKLDYISLEIVSMDLKSKRETR